MDTNINPNQQQLADALSKLVQQQQVSTLEPIPNYVPPSQSSGGMMGGLPGLSGGMPGMGSGGSGGMPGLSNISSLFNLGSSPASTAPAADGGTLEAGGALDLGGDAGSGAASADTGLASAGPFGWAILAGVLADKASDGRSTRALNAASGIPGTGGDTDQGDWSILRDGGLSKLGAPSWINPQNWFNG